MCETYKGVGDRCGVEVTKSAVRRERMGHIELAARYLISGISKEFRVAGLTLIFLRNTGAACLLCKLYRSDPADSG